tara:strand:+ start:681 stop:1013 length:333 start_codon:yes stop_codon:yes gene_type:complete
MSREKHKEEAVERMTEAIGGVANSAERLRMLLAKLPINCDIIVRETSVLSLWLSRYSVASADYRILTSSEGDAEADEDNVSKANNKLAELLDELKPYLEDRQGNGGYELN